MKQKNNWLRNGQDFYPVETSDISNTLSNGMYKVNLNPMTEKVYLTRIFDKFELPSKIYGKESVFVQRVLKTWNNTSDNLGILLNGLKGTGKTVTSQIICNEINLPVLIVHSNIKQLPSFLNEIQQECVVMFDEYEKIYTDRESDILTVMDGILTTEHRKMFILTTNDTFINDNLLQRPGRIRYLKTFNDLTIDVITEIVDDKLVNKEFKDSIIEFISKLQVITMDIVNSIISEVNIHGDLPTDFEDIFNIKRLNHKFDLFVVENYGTVNVKFIPLKKNMAVNYPKITDSTIDKHYYVNDNEEYYGKIYEILDDNVFILTELGHELISRLDHVYGKKDKSEEDEEISSIVIYQKPIVQTHKSFYKL